MNQNHKLANTEGKGYGLHGIYLSDNQDQVLARGLEQWGAQPQCATTKTGYAKTKRAYLLNECTFTVSSARSLEGERVHSATYRFLDARLIDIVVLFGTKSEQALGERSLTRLAKAWGRSYGPPSRSDPEQIQWQQQDEEILLTLNGQLTLRITNRRILDGIHALKGTAR